MQTFGYFNLSDEPVIELGIGSSRLESCWWIQASTGA